MEIRFFQIVVPLFSLVLIYRQLSNHNANKSTVFETGMIIFFWAMIGIVAIFPDFFSKGIAKIFGFKDNVNAIIFFALGLLFYFQFQLYKILKKQDELLTELARKNALDNADKN